MTDKVRDFIVKNKDLLEENDFTSFFNKAAEEFNLYSLRGELTSIFINSGINFLKYVDTIYDGCFYFTSINKISIPNNITRIGRSSFRACLNLKKVTIPKSVKVIEEYAFSNCKSLREIEIPAEVHTIAPGTFDECSVDLIITTPKNSAAYEYAMNRNLKVNLI